ncbi:MAG: TatD family hydrolase [Clostridiales bacterium]|nr:TatD family hydrolase [Clostridiales bacterium]
MYKNIFDSHAHYDDPAFDPDRDELLTSLPENGVCAVISCGCDLKSCEANMRLAQKYEFVFFAAGFHPESLAGAALSDISKIEKYLNHEKCVAIGEIGLDYHYMAAAKDVQKEFFMRQLFLAKELDMPVIIHDREAHGDTLEIIKQIKPGGVLHCFSGSRETANEIIKAGMYIGVGGSSTFKNAKKTLEVAAALPLERLLLETDCPYLAPVPFRGRRNDSSLIAYVAENLGRARNMPAQEIIDIAAENARRLFKIKTR